MNLTTILQVVFLFVIFCLCFLCVVLPLKLIPKSVGEGDSQKSGRILSFCNCFSGGVFLGTCFLQLIPFIQDKFNEVFYNSGISMRYSCAITQVTVVVGFFLILLVEQMVRVCQNKEEKKKDGVEMLRIPVDFTVTSSDEGASDESEVEIYSDKKRLLNTNPAQASPESSTSKSARSNGTTSEAVAASKHDLQRIKQMNGKMVKEVLMNHEHRHSHHGHSHLTDILKEDFGLRCLLLLLALSIHSIFEGMAIGLQDSTYKLITLFIGVAIHEILVAFAMGINLAQQNLKAATIVKLCLVFSSTIPVGMGIGMGMKGFTSLLGQLVSASIQGITAGTFVYVTFLEILPAEINSPNNRLLKVLFMFLGFGVIACLKFSIKEGDYLQSEPYYQPKILSSKTG